MSKFHFWSCIWITCLQIRGNVLVFLLYDSSSRVIICSIHTLTVTEDCLQECVLEMHNVTFKTILNDINPFMQLKPFTNRPIIEFYTLSIIP